MFDLEQMNSFSLTIDGKPKSKNGVGVLAQRGRVRVYRSSRIKEEEKTIAITCARKMIRERIEIISQFSPIFLDVRFYVDLPKYLQVHMAKSGLTIEDIENMPALHSNQQGDIDNMMKLLNDGLEGVLFENDKSLYGATINRLYSEAPRIEIDVYWFDQSSHWLFSKETTEFIKEYRAKKRNKRKNTEERRRATMLRQRSSVHRV
jgi:Holliday junction resolvase RusA-like endonuclease